MGKATKLEHGKLLLCRLLTCGKMRGLCLKKRLVCFTPGACSQESISVTGYIQYLMILTTQKFILLKLNTIWHKNFFGKRVIFAIVN